MRQARLPPGSTEAVVCRITTILGISGEGELLKVLWWPSGRRKAAKAQPAAAKSPRSSPLLGSQPLGGMVDEEDGYRDRVAYFDRFLEQLDGPAPLPARDAPSTAPVVPVSPAKHPPTLPPPATAPALDIFPVKGKRMKRTASAPWGLGVMPVSRPRTPAMHLDGANQVDVSLNSSSNTSHRSSAVLLPDTPMNNTRPGSTVTATLVSSSRSLNRSRSLLLRSSELLKTPTQGETRVPKEGGRAAVPLLDGLQDIPRSSRRPLRGPRTAERFEDGNNRPSTGSLEHKLLLAKQSEVANDDNEHMRRLFTLYCGSDSESMSVKSLQKVLDYLTLFLPNSQLCSVAGCTASKMSTHNVGFDSFCDVIIAARSFRSSAVKEEHEASGETRLGFTARTASVGSVDGPRQRYMKGQQQKLAAVQLSVFEDFERQRRGSKPRTTSRPPSPYERRQDIPASVGDESTAAQAAQELQDALAEKAAASKVLVGVREKQRTSVGLVGTEKALMEAEVAKAKARQGKANDTYKQLLGKGSTAKDEEASMVKSKSRLSRSSVSKAGGALTASSSRRSLVKGGAVSSSDFERTKGIKPSEMPFELYSQAVRREDAYHVMKDRFSGHAPPKAQPLALKTVESHVVLRRSSDSPPAVSSPSPGKNRAPIPLHEQVVSTDARMRASSKMLLGEPMVRDEHRGANPVQDLRRRIEQLTEEEERNNRLINEDEDFL